LTGVIESYERQRWPLGNLPGGKRLNPSERSDAGLKTNLYGLTCADYLRLPSHADPDHPINRREYSLVLLKMVRVWGRLATGVPKFCNVAHARGLGAMPHLGGGSMKRPPYLRCAVVPPARIAAVSGGKTLRGWRCAATCTAKLRLGNVVAHFKLQRKARGPGNTGKHQTASVATSVRRAAASAR